EPRAGGDLLAQPDRHVHPPPRRSLERPRGADDQVVLDGAQLRALDLEADPVAAPAELEGVGQLEGAEEGLDLVVARLLPGQDAQDQVDLGGRADDRRLPAPVRRGAHGRPSCRRAGSRPRTTDAASPSTARSTTASLLSTSPRDRPSCQAWTRPQMVTARKPPMWNPMAKPIAFSRGTP